VVVGQSAVDQKTNEIKVAQPLLDPLDLVGHVVTADAMHTQAAFARSVVDEKQADYVLTVKDNQRLLKTHLAQMTWDFPPQAETRHKGHGRIERPRIWVSTAIRGSRWFPRVEQCFRIERDTTDLHGRAMRHEYADGVSSCLPEEVSPEDLLHFVHGHWGIENKLHWVRDVTFDEDRSQIRTGTGPQTMATLRHLAVSLLRLNGHRNLAQATRYDNAHRHEALRLIGASLSRALVAAIPCSSAQRLDFLCRQVGRHGPRLIFAPPPTVRCVSDDQLPWTLTNSWRVPPGYLGCMR
jgi:predicted transposase YbfD/YdcC